MRCANCNGTDFVNAKAVRTIDVPFKFKKQQKRVGFRAHVPVRKCKSCGTEYEIGPMSERLELTVATRLIALGISAGDILRFARKALGLRALDLAELLGVTPETVSHWENDKTPIDRGAWVTLRALVEDHLNGRTTTEEQLKAFATPIVPKGPLEFDVSVEAP